MCIGFGASASGFRIFGFKAVVSGGGLEGLALVVALPAHGGPCKTVAKEQTMGALRLSIGA